MGEEGSLLSSTTSHTYVTWGIKFNAGLLIIAGSSWGAGWREYQLSSMFTQSCDVVAVWESKISPAAQTEKARQKENTLKLH